MAKGNKSNKKNSWKSDEYEDRKQQKNKTLHKKNQSVKKEILRELGA